MEKNIYCETLNHWCDSWKDAALLAGCNMFRIRYNLNLYGRFVSKDGLVFVKKPRTSTNLKQDKTIVASKLKMVQLKCLETDEIVASIKALGEKVGLKTSHCISNALRIYGSYIDKFGHTWVRLDGKCKGIRKRLSSYEKSNRHGRPAKEITCVQTGEKFKSASVLSAVVGHSGSWITNCLTTEGQYKRNGKTYVYTDHMSPAKPITDGNVIVCKETGDRFESLELFSKYVNKSVDAVSNIFKNNGKYMTSDEHTYVVEKASTIELPKVEVKKEEVKSEEKVNNSGRGRNVKCLETGEIFKSAAELARKLDMVYCWIHTCLNKQGFYKKDGKTYKFVDMLDKNIAIPEKQINNSHVEKETTTEKVIEQTETPKAVKAAPISVPMVENKVVHSGKSHEQIVLEDTVISFTRKGLYNEAIIICESLNKIYMTK